MSAFCLPLSRVPMRQRGAMTILTVFIMLMTLGALGVLGLGQVVWEREEVQRIADLAAKAAASDIGNASQGFTVAVDYAKRNGLEDTTDSISINCNVRGTDTLLAASACQRSVLVRVTRSVPAAFLGTKPVTAVAEATVTPLISGLVGTNLLSVDLNGSALSPLMEAIGTELRLDVLGFQGLLASDTQVDLLQLGIELGALSSGDQLDMSRLLGTEVSAGQLLDAALDVVGASAPVVTIPNNGPIRTTDFFLSEILSADTSGASDFVGSSVRLGNLAFASSFAAVTGMSGSGIQLNLGNTLNVSVLNPPQLFVATKMTSDGSVIATARTEQVSIATKINGVIELTVTAGGGEVEIKDIDCRLPQSQSSVMVDIDSSPISADLKLPSVTILKSLLGLLGLGTITYNYDLNTISADLGSSSANDIKMVGYPDPTVTSSYSFEASQGVDNLLSDLNTGIFGLTNILQVLTANLPLKTAVDLLGPGLDEILDVLGLNVNEVVVQVDNMDCFNTAVLTR